MSGRPRSLFRSQAVAFHSRGGVRGDVLQITSKMLHRAQWLACAILAAGLVFVCKAEVRCYAAGPAVVLLDARNEVTASRAGVVAEIAVRVGQRVQAGDLLLRLQAQTELAELMALDRELEDQLVLLMRRPDDRAARDAILGLRARRNVAEIALKRSELRASEAGEVSDLRVRLGQLVEAGSPLLALQSEPFGAHLTALLPGAERPRIHPGMPLRMRVVGFERTSMELTVEQVDAQVLGPREATRTLGTELTDSLEIAGPIVLVHARLPSTVLARGVTYRLHHGMQARVEIAVDQQPVLYAWLPGLQEALGDVL